MKFDHTQDNIGDACGVDPKIIDIINDKTTLIVRNATSGGNVCRSMFAEEIAKTFSYEELVIAHACLLELDVKRQSMKRHKRKDKAAKKLTEEILKHLSDSVKKEPPKFVVPPEEVKKQPSIFVRLWNSTMPKQWSIKP